MQPIPHHDDLEADESRGQPDHHLHGVAVLSPLVVFGDVDQVAVGVGEVRQNRHTDGDDPQENDAETRLRDGTGARDCAAEGVLHRKFARQAERAHHKIDRQECRGDDGDGPQPPVGGVQRDFHG